jgi:hypothetical protein
MNSATARDLTFTIEPTPQDVHDCPYRFGKPLTYLSERQQARLLLLRGRLCETAPPARPSAD